MSEAGRSPSTPYLPSCNDWPLVVYLLCEHVFEFLKGLLKYCDHPLTLIGGGYYPITKEGGVLNSGKQTHHCRRCGTVMVFSSPVPRFCEYCQEATYLRRPRGGHRPGDSKALDGRTLHSSERLAD